MIVYFGNGYVLETLNQGDEVAIFGYMNDEQVDSCCFKWDRLPEILEKVKSWHK